MADLVHNTDYIGEGQGRLLAMFKDKPRVLSLIKSWLLPAQAIEDAAYDILVERLLQNGPTGDLLAKIGKIVGQGNEGLSDAQFALLIQARIKANRSNGEREDLIGITTLLIPSTFIYVRNFPTGILINPQGAVGLPPALVGLSFLAPATAAGALLMFVWTITDWAHTLILGSVYGPPNPTANQSLGSVNAPVAPQPGYLYDFVGGREEGVIQDNGGSA